MVLTVRGPARSLHEQQVQQYGARLTMSQQQVAQHCTCKQLHKLTHSGHACL